MFQPLTWEVRAANCWDGRCLFHSRPSPIRRRLLGRAVGAKSRQDRERRILPAGRQLQRLSSE